MFYQVVLVTHSWIRWLVLIALLFAIYRAFKGWISASRFGKVDGFARNFASILVRVEMAIGVLLYILSPITRYFISNIKEGVSIPDVSMFGYMHPIAMIGAIALISIGEARSKKASEDRKKFSGIAVFYLVALLLVLAAIPWPFYQSGSRPLFRPF